MNLNSSKQKLVVIVGPTASGKSNLALRLARLAPSFTKVSASRQGKLFKKHGIMGAEIISADSRQVYHGMDIGTGKVTKQEQKIVKHYLLDVVSPKKQFTANDFKKLGEKAIQEITAKHKIPIIVGGTGFYIDILLGRMAVAEVPPNKKLRVKLEKQSAEQLFKQLLKLDPKRTKTIDRYNKRRLVRALEIALITGKPVPKIESRTKNLESRKYQILWLGLKPKNLEKRIKIRLDKRLSHGIIKEVERLHQQGVSWKRLDSFGLEYRWVSHYLREVKSKKHAPYGSKASRSGLKVKSFKKSELYEKLLREIIKYSKRQMTWFKKNEEITWIKNQREATKLIKLFVL